MSQKMSKKPVKAMRDFRVLIIYPNLPLIMIPGIAIGLFTRILRDQGYIVDLFDTTNYDTDDLVYSESPTYYMEHRVELLNARKFNITTDLDVKIKTDMLSDFRKKVETFDPDFLIITLVEDAFLQTIAMLDAVEDLDIPHLVGGVFPTLAPDRCINTPQIRLIGPGEGEKTIIAVAEAVRLGKRLDNIPGTWMRSDNGDVIKNPPPPLVDIAEVQPDFSLFDESRFMRPMGGRIFKLIPVESYRGCPYSCAYCISPGLRGFSTGSDLGNFMRRKSMASLRDELARYIEIHDPEFFFFIDDCFLARPRDEIWEFCDMYEEFKLPFYFNTRAENCDSEILKRIKEVGCYRISYGIECGNEQYRQKVLRRKISNAEIIDRFKQIADSGIVFSLNLIIGMPYETRELVMDTVELVRSIRGYDTVTTFIFTPYHGTALRRVAVDNGWLDADTITIHNTSRSLLDMPPPYLSPDEIDGLVAVLPLYCYFPKSEWENLRRAEVNDEEGSRIRKHYADIYTENFLKATQGTEKTFIDDPGDDPRADAEAYSINGQKRLTAE